MSESLTPAKAPKGGAPRSRLPRALQHLTTIAAAAMLLVVARGAWSVNQTLDLVQGERARLLALEDSLRSETLSERRLREIEQRLGRLERSLSFASRAARVSEVIALRQWARRLDAGIQTGSDRISRIEGRIDSLLNRARSADSLSGSDWRGPEAQAGASRQRP